MGITGITAAGFAERVDRLTGIRETAEFAGADPRLLRFVHWPASESFGCVFICSSVYAEFAKNYRREVRLARKLAATGLIAVRVHYRGTGNSGGDSAGQTLAGLVADISETAHEVSSKQGLRELAYVGTKVGGIVAALAAPPNAPLALWEPVWDGNSWLRDAIMSMMASRASLKSQGSAEDFAALDARLAREGRLDLLGFGVYRRLVDDLRQANLESLLENRQGRILVLQLGSGSEPRPSTSQLVDRLRRKGSVVDLKAVAGEVAWWFDGHGSPDSSTDNDVIEPTAAWLLQALEAPR